MRDHELHYMQRALHEARKSRPEDDRVHPLVGAVVVRNHSVLATAFRGEIPGNHAEYIALETKLDHDTLAGADVYTTLEPCTTRNHPNIPCAEWLIQRKVARVVIGMLDPNQAITGKGVRRLRDANVATDFFPSMLMAESEEMNRHFTRNQEGRTALAAVTRSHSETLTATKALCLRATKNIRFLVHALGIDHKLPDQLASAIAIHIKACEAAGTPLRFWPIIVVDNSINPAEFARALSLRAALYAQHGVSEFVIPRFVRTDVPIGIDVLLIDNREALLSITTAGASRQTQIGIALAQHAALMSELVDWFDQVVAGGSVSLEVMRESLRPLIR